MKSLRNGLNKKIKPDAKKALYKDCFVDQLNLALQHYCNLIKIARSCFDTLNLEFIVGSSKRLELFQRIQDSKYLYICRFQVPFKYTNGFFWHYL